MSESGNSDYLAQRGNFDYMSRNGSFDDMVINPLQRNIIVYVVGVEQWPEGDLVDVVYKGLDFDTAYLVWRTAFSPHSLIPPKSDNWIVSP